MARKIPDYMKGIRIAQGTRLRALRLDRGDSQRNVERFTAVPHSTLGAAERGKAFLTQPDLITLAGFYGVSAAYILAGGTLKRKLRTAVEAINIRR